MRDYGGDIPCPTRGHPHHVTPRQLQADLEITFTCSECGHEVEHENAVAREIAEHFETIKVGLRRLKI
jgi:transcription elongation factor Elf1